MKRHRLLKFYIDSTRNIFKGSNPATLSASYKAEQKEHISQKYGALDFEKKFDRWFSIPKPVLSVVDEHTHLLQDIEDAYIGGSLYSALTGACCLGERIFNQIILRTREGHRSTTEYKQVYRRGSLNDWNLGINTLVAWKIIEPNTEKKYRRLGELRNESVHFQNKPQDLEVLTKEAIILINEIVSDLFELRKEKKFIIWFEVPGEMYLRKEAESNPFIQAFYIPCAPLVGFKHTIEAVSGLRMKVVDTGVYPNTEVSDDEFVRLRNEHTKKG